MSLFDEVPKDGAFLVRLKSLWLVDSSDVYFARARPNMTEKEAMDPDFPRWDLQGYPIFLRDGNIEAWAPLPSGFENITFDPIK